MTEKVMTCGQAKTTIQCSLDSLPPPKERLALEAHLEVCAACRREQDAQRRLTRLTDRWASRAIEASDPGEEWTAQILSRLDTRPAPARLPVWLPAAAALLLAAALTLIPGLQPPSLGLTTQIASLPVWLRANLTALPGDAHSVLAHSALQGLYAAWMPAWTAALLCGVFLLNAGFCVHARQRSFS